MGDLAKVTSVVTICATIAICAMCFAAYSCSIEDNKLRSKCIEAKGTWMPNTSGGACIVK